MCYQVKKQLSIQVAIAICNLNNLCRRQLIRDIENCSLQRHDNLMKNANDSIKSTQNKPIYNTHTRFRLITSKINRSKYRKFTHYYGIDVNFRKSFRFWMRFFSNLFSLFLSIGGDVTMTGCFLKSFGSGLRILYLVRIIVECDGLFSAWKINVERSNRNASQHSFIPELETIPNPRSVIQYIEKSHAVRF